MAMTLRDEIAEALREVFALDLDLPAERLEELRTYFYGRLADAVMAVVQPGLDAAGDRENQTNGGT
jgi:hypothetical protein